MVQYSSNEAARRLGVSPSGLSKHIRLGKIPAPQAVKTGEKTVFSWSDDDIERVRKLLPKIKNGRKTRYAKSTKSGVRSQESVKPKPTPKEKPQPKKAVPHRKKK